jgi:hypothetical protein
MDLLVMLHTPSEVLMDPQTPYIYFGDVLNELLSPYYDEKHPQVKRIGLPGVGVTTLVPPLARVVKEVLGVLLYDLEQRGATEVSVRVQFVDNPASHNGRGFTLDVIDNGRVIEVSSEILAIAEQSAFSLRGGGLTWSIEDGRNVARLTEPFNP